MSQVQAFAIRDASRTFAEGNEMSASASTEATALSQLTSNDAI